MLSEDHLSVEIVPALNKECLQDIDDWSHVWIIYIGTCSQVDGIVCKIASHDGRLLRLCPLEPLPLDARIVDIKPYHFLESASSSSLVVS